MKTQTNQTHTPGPWRLLDNAILSDHINYAGNFIVTELSHRADAEHSANARLIAAAPELLAALKDAESAMRGAGNVKGDRNAEDAFAAVQLRVSAAIAKVEGTT